MDMTPSTTTAPKSPEPESETPTRIQPAKPISFSNGIIKRHHNNHHHPLLFTYKECLKNHAAALGSHALDGCGEFMPAPSSISTDPASLKCAACGCHRNFHRREPETDFSSPNSSIPPPSSTVAAAIEYQPHHRHHPPPPPQLAAPHPHPPPRSPNSASPPPISSSYMLLSLSGTNNNNLAFSDLNFSGNNNSNHHHHNPPGSRKRFRTKFSQFQKEKMHEFADRVGWKMQKRDEDDVRDFCRQIGVDKSVLKVWMHNNKNSFNRRDLPPFSLAGAAEIRKIDNGGGANHTLIPTGEANNNNNNNGGNELHHSVSSGGGGFDSDSGGGGGDGARGGNVNGSSSS